MTQRRQRWARCSGCSLAPRAGKNDDGSFGNKRSEAVRFARYDISVPPDRKLGQITWPPRHGAINPEKQFLTTDELIYQADVAFRADLKTQLAARGGEAVIFVHGYNNNFAEGVYRVAQFAHDLKLPGAVVPLRLALGG